MGTLDTLSEAVLQACISTDRYVGLEIAVNHDNSSSMYGETIYNILLEGEVDAEFYDVKEALTYLSLMDDTYD